MTDPAQPLINAIELLRQSTRWIDEEESPSALDLLVEIRRFITNQPSAKTAPATQAYWLIEWADPDLQTKWWHPVIGWTVHATKASRFVRREDAEAFIKTSRFVGGIVATEHCDIERLKEGVE